MGPRRSGTAKHRESGDHNISGMTSTEEDPHSSQSIKTKSSYQAIYEEVISILTFSLRAHMMDKMKFKQYIHIFFIVQQDQKGRKNIEKNP